MPSRTVLVAILCVGLCLGGVAAAWYTGWRSDPRPAPGSTVTPLPPSVERPPPPRPVPPRLQARYARLRDSQKAGRYRDAIEAYPAFLADLEEDWGKDNAALANYHYDFALALKLAGQPARCLEWTARALEKWPDDLHLQVLEATTRAREALEPRALDRRADALFRRFLKPENHARLRGLRLALPELYALWAEMLLRANRPVEALELSETGLALDPQRGCLEIKARALLLLHRPEEALAVLRGLPGETPFIELYRGMAEQETGRLEMAWKHFSALLERQAEAIPPGLLEDLRLRAATVLNGLGRSGEALTFLADALARSPDDARFLNQLVLATRSLGRRDATGAINRRVRGLLHREDLLQTGRKAQAAGDLASASYYQALAAAAVHRLGEALLHLERGLEQDPALAPLYLEEARLLLVLGRYDGADFVLRRGMEKVKSPVLLAELARVQALRGDQEAARRTLAQAAAPRPGTPTRRPEPARHAAVALRLARVRLELGETAAARQLVSGLNPATSERAEERSLCLAEIALREGSLEESRKHLAGSVQGLPGGESWARALRALLEGGSTASAAGDPSDLLDHPRLLSTGAPPGAAPGGGSLDPVRIVHGRRMSILARMEGRADRDVVSGWRELLALYLEVGAARKAREVAWWLAHLRPGDLEAKLELVRTLAVPEEAVTRFSLLTEAARSSPSDASVRRDLMEVSEFLGLKS